MAISKVFISSLLISLLLFHYVSEAEAAGKINCGSACEIRCKLSSRPNLCKRACGTCCARCSCVPPGTSGNQNVCPCYASQTTHGGKRKCP